MQEYIIAWNTAIRAKPGISLVQIPGLAARTLSGAFASLTRGISIIGTENWVKHYYIDNTNLFQCWNPCFLVKQLSGNLKNQLLQPSKKSLQNKTFKLNPIFCTDDTCTPCTEYGLDPDQLKRGHIIGAAWIHDYEQEGNAYGYVIGNFKLFPKTFSIRGRMPVFWLPANEQERAIFAQAWEMIMGKAR